EVLERGQLLVIFPEGTRNHGPVVGPLEEGAMFLAARAGVPVVPVGIAGSEDSMPKGRRIPKRLRIWVVVGEALAPPAGGEGGRVPRSQVRAGTEELCRGIQSAFDQACAGFERGAG
ncbi:MAG: lysophospholipid acyltransferase family protein, partial [Acidimicrobiales bacterium]